MTFHSLRLLAESVLPTPLWQRLRLIHERARLTAFRPYTSVHRFGNRELAIHVADQIARSWYDVDWTVPGEIQLLANRGQLKHGVTVFDLGAHHAVVAMILADYVGDSGRVIAVEASAHNVEVALVNVAANDMNMVTVVHAAVSDSGGDLRFVPALNGQVATDYAPAVIVPATTVDLLTERYGPPAVVFMDVEGYEINVLRGAVRTIETACPDICIEVHAGGNGLEKFGTVDDLLALLPSDYSILVSPAADVAYVPLAEGASILERHSRLVALAPVAAT